MVEPPADYFTHYTAVGIDLPAWLVLPAGAAHDSLLLSQDYIDNRLFQFPGQQSTRQL